MIKRLNDFKKWERLNNSRWEADGGYYTILIEIDKNPFRTDSRQFKSVSEWGKSEVKVEIVTYGKEKWDQKVKRFNKNIAGNVLTYNSKYFHWLNKKTRPWILDRKNHWKKIPVETQKTVKIKRGNAACEQKTTREKAHFSSYNVFFL